MSNELKVFENQEFGEIRTVQKDGDTWFVFKDICAALDMDTSNLTKMIERLDEDEKGRCYIPTPSGKQMSWIINEYGLYHFLVRSEKEKAKPFRRWVTHEVLPSIRSNGGYISGQEHMSDIEVLANAVLVAQNVIKQKEAKIEALQEEIQEMLPKAEYFDELCDRNALTSIRDTAKMLCIPQNRFVFGLITLKWLYRNADGKLRAWSTYINKGYFEYKECIPRDNGKLTKGMTFVTFSGRNALRELVQTDKWYEAMRGYVPVRRSKQLKINAIETH